MVRFFEFSSKRTSVLTEETEASDSEQKKLKQLCRTRIACRKNCIIPEFLEFISRGIYFLLESNISFYLLGDHKVKSNII